jgi:Phage integrase family
MPISKLFRTSLGSNGSLTSPELSGGQSPKMLARFHRHSDRFEALCCSGQQEQVDRNKFLNDPRQSKLYDLRHTFLTRLGESGCDVWTLARIAGHSNIKQSSRYVHPSDDAVLGAMERMGGKSGAHKIGHNAIDENAATANAVI